MAATVKKCIESYRFGIHVGGLRDFVIQDDHCVCQKNVTISQWHFMNYQMLSSSEETQDNKTNDHKVFLVYLIYL